MEAFYLKMMCQACKRNEDCGNCQFGNKCNETVNVTKKLGIILNPAEWTEKECELISKEYNKERS